MRLNYPLLIKVCGLLVLIEGLAMLPCAAVAASFRETTVVLPLLITGSVCVVLGGLIMGRLKFQKIHLKMREGFLLACLSWVLCSLIGMIPFYCSKYGFSFISCLFESVAGFTTTGCTVLNLDMMPKSLLLWRAICHWLGGVGILILIISIFPKLGVGGKSIISAEAPGPRLEQMGTTISATAKYLYGIYIFFTVSEFLLLLIGPMDWFEALTATLSSISTAGLMIHSGNAILFQSTYVRFVIMLFTLLSSMNFLIFFMLISGRHKEAFSNLEARAYLSFLCIAAGAIALVLWGSGTYTSLWQAAKDSLCQVVSIMSTSGYFVCDYMDWPDFTHAVLFLLMFIGGCSASTSGSLKVIRVVVLFKLIKRGVFRRVHPNSVKPILLEGKPIPAGMAASITMHILLFFGVIFAGCLLLSFNNLDMETTISSVVGLFSNTGMALGEVGSTGYFGMWNDFSQVVMMLLMLAGRLEMYAIILLFSRSFWQPNKAQTI